MADMLLAVQMERLRVEEALAARDNVVAHLEDAYASVRQKAATILRLEQELGVFKRASTPANTNPSSSEILSEPPGMSQSDPGEVFEGLAENRASIVAHVSLNLDHGDPTIGAIDTGESRYSPRNIE